MQMNVSVELEGATETSGKLVELKKQIDVVNAELSKLRNMCNAFVPINMKVEANEKEKRSPEGVNRERKVWYQCDPARNPKCPKTTCKYNPDAVCLPEVRRCDRTSEPEAARR